MRPRRPNPTLFQIDTRAWLHELGRQRNDLVTLEDVPDQELDRLQTLGFDWVWLMGIWQTGELGRQVSTKTPEWQPLYHQTLADFSEEDVSGSPFAIAAYSVHERLGGEGALASLRGRLQMRGIRLMLDFVPNHTAIDHPWVYEHPGYYVAGNEELLAQQPQNYRRVETSFGWQVLAHGRDPYFPGWPDTLQLNYGDAGLRKAMTSTLLHVAKQCDGVRCDMAMLVLPDVFNSTWNIDMESFWPQAIETVEAEVPGFIFMAEVYWGRESQLHDQGFDFTYDKDLYDKLVHAEVQGIRSQLRVNADFQRRSVHFLENHDEPRAASVFTSKQQRAAAMISYLIPGLRFFHHGQPEGNALRPSVHLRRRPTESRDAEMMEFYESLLELLKEPLYQGEWRLLEHWGDPAIFCFSWISEAGKSAVVAVNFSASCVTGYVRTPQAVAGTGMQIKLRSGADDAQVAQREIAPAIFMALEPWGFALIES